MTIENVTPEMLELIKQIGEKNKDIDEDLCLSEDMRWHEFPIEKVWEFGSQNLPLWKYRSNYYDAYFAGTEEQIIQRFKEILE